MRKTTCIATLLLLACGACAAHQSAPPPETSEVAVDHEETTTGWRTLDSLDPPTNRQALRAELEERRHTTLETCEDVARTLEERRNNQGSVLSTVFNTTIATFASALATNGPVGSAGNTTAQQQQQPLPLGGGVNVGSRIALGTHIDHLRRALRDLAQAQSNAQIYDALDRIRPVCTTR